MQIGHQSNSRYLYPLNERLEQFAGLVSHDLRNPLNVAQARLDLASAECESEHLDIASDALTRIEDLIDDVLSFAKAGESVSDPEPISLNELCEDCWKTLPTDDATLDLNVDCTIQADRSRVRQLLDNLFQNAIEHGGRDVTITVGELEDGFYIEDDGSGIPDDAGEDLFEAGYTSKEDGTGFGLSIVKQVVEAHGWDITATKGSGGGARFEITGI